VQQPATFLRPAGGLLAKPSCPRPVFRLPLSRRAVARGEGGSDFRFPYFSPQPLALSLTPPLPVTTVTLLHINDLTRNKNRHKADTTLTGPVTKAWEVLLSAKTRFLLTRNPGNLSRV
jgi:hypothetical protein